MDSWSLGLFQWRMQDFPTTKAGAKFFSKSCMKMKKNRSQRGRASLATPVGSANISGSTSLLIVTELITRPNVKSNKKTLCDVKVHQLRNYNHALYQYCCVTFDGIVYVWLTLHIVWSYVNFIAAYLFQFTVYSFLQDITYYKLLYLSHVNRLLADHSKYIPRSFNINALVCLFYRSLHFSQVLKQDELHSAWGEFSHLWIHKCSTKQ